MSVGGQHRRLVLLTLLCLVASACSAVSSSSSTTAPPPSVALPPLTIAGLRASEQTVDTAAAADETARPDEAQQALDEAGFLGARQRTLTGRVGVFSRVVLRAWVFSSESGATTFASWMRDHADDLIGTSTAVRAELPSGVSLALHTPSGCCHEEVPIYLAIWQRGPIVWTIRASGARIRTAPVVALVGSVVGEV
jgi:hypothetical protein